jgi:hypothetical protein
MTNSLTGIPASAAAFLFDMDGTLLGSYIRLEYTKAKKADQAANRRLYTRRTSDLGVLCSRVLSGPHRGVEEWVQYVPAVFTTLSD